MSAHPPFDRPVLIVGAGIAGLACALALAKHGIASLVCERAERLEAAGAGLQLSANALSVLRRLDVFQRLAPLAFAAKTVALRDGASDRLLARVPVESGADGYLAVHRTDLQAALLKASEAEPLVELRLGHALRSVSVEADGLRALFAAAHGEEAISAPLLVGADGVRSATASLLGHAGPIDSGLVAHRFSVSDAPGAEIEAWLSPAAHAVSYPMRASGERNLVVIGRSREAAELTTRGWNPRLSGFVRDGAHLGEWPLLTVDTRARFQPSRRVVLVGDAGHAMFPFAAQGAAMALEDAWVLAASLAASPSIEAALARYADERLPRIEKVLKRVGFHRFVYHLPWPATVARNLAMRLRSGASMRRDLAWLYDWRADAPTS